MRRTAIILFAAGIVLEVLAFTIPRVDGSSRIAMLVAPGSVTAGDALEVLERSGTLPRDAPGFPVLASLFLAQLEAQNPEREVDVNVTKIERSRASAGPSEDHAADEVSVAFTLSNGQALDWNVSALRSHVESRVSTRLWWSATVLLGLGVVLQVAALVLLIRARRGD